MTIFIPMVRESDIRDFLKTELPLIDVRSPGEFVRGHIPGAVNIPLFSDAERAHIGTVYTRISGDKALELGYQYVTPKLEHLVSQANKAAPYGKAAVHCWRGGLRSRTFARHLCENGFSEINVITGGYKSYRNHITGFFDTPFDLIIISGYTGSGKTELIRFLRHKGHQVIDVEGLASHKGSAFGGLGMNSQPSCEQFENDLFDEFRKLDLSRPIWIEDESRNIGAVNIPLNLYRQMQKSRIWFIDIPKEKRVNYLINEYAGYDTRLLEEAIMKISKRLGGENTKTALRYLGERQLYQSALLILDYYDKSYLNGLRLHVSERIRKIHMEDINPVENARLLLEYEEQYQQGKSR